MRLSLVLYGQLDFVSGGFLYDRQLLRVLRSRGDEVQVLALPWRSYLRGLWDNCSPALRRRLSAGSVEIQLQDELAHPSLFWLNRRLRPRPRLVAIVHHLRCAETHPVWQKRFYAQVERCYLKSVDAYIVNSQATLASVRALAGAARPAVVAPPGAPQISSLPTPGEIAARLRETGPRRLIFLGNVIPRKGLHTLLAALAELRMYDWQLTVVGSLTLAPAYVRKIQALAAAWKLTDRLKFTGALPQAAVWSRLAHSHVLAVPSEYEGFGICYLEGMAFGLPAIGSTAGGAAEIISPGQNGFLVAPGDRAALRNCLQHLFTDQELLLRLSLAAQERFRSHPTWEESLAAVHRFLHSLRTPC